MMVFNKGRDRKDTPGKQQAKATPEEKRRAYLRNRRFLRAGQALIAIAVIIGSSHWGVHAFAPQEPPLWTDFFIGYPTAALLLISGGMLIGKK